MCVCVRSCWRVAVKGQGGSSGGGWSLVGGALEGSGANQQLVVSGAGERRWTIRSEAEL